MYICTHTYIYMHMYVTVCACCAIFSNSKLQHKCTFVLVSESKCYRYVHINTRTLAYILVKVSTGAAKTLKYALIAGYKSKEAR